MYIFVDESGSFVNKGATRGSYCVVAAFLIPEPERRNCYEILRRLKLRQQRSASYELKLRDVSEQNYYWLLDQLAGLRGALLCVATDSALNSDKVVSKHQGSQVQLIRNSVDTMIHEGGKEGMRLLARQLEHLPSQLYTQLTVQIHLMHEVISRGISYFVQRQPNSLSTFRWRIDQKDPSVKTDFEDAFEKYAPDILQAISITAPYPMLEWCDYTPMKKFMYSEGTIPKHLVHRLPHLANAEALNGQKIIRDDLSFIDSLVSPGIQIADLLASGVRRLLRGGFSDNALASKKLGGLMIERETNSPPIRLLSFGLKTRVVKEVANSLRIATLAAKPMVLKNPRLEG